MTKQYKNKIVGAFALIAMALLMLPVFTMSADAAAAKNVKISNASASVELTDGFYTTDGSTKTDSATEPTNVDSYAWYKDGKLILKDFVLGTSNSYYKIDNAIYAEGNLTVELKGNNKLYSYKGIFTYNADLTIQGEGSLYAGKVMGLQAKNIIINSGTVKCSCTEDVGAAIYASGNVYIHGGDITALSTYTYAAEAGLSSQCYGIYTPTYGSITIDGGTVTAKALGSALYKDVTINGKYTATASTSVSASSPVSFTSGNNATNYRWMKITVTEAPPHVHAGTLVEEDPATTSSTGTKAHYKCSCGKLFSDSACKTEVTADSLVIPKLEECSHTYEARVRFNASVKRTGWVDYYCTKCDKKDSSQTIKCKMIGRIELNKTSATYTGKTMKPSVSVYDYEGGKISTNYYTVKTNKTAKDVGKYTVTVTFRNGYEYQNGKASTTYGWEDGGETTKLYFTIKAPTVKKASISSVTGSKKAMTVKWKRVSSISGYQIRYSLKSSMKSAKVVNKSTKYVSTKITKLSAKKKYYVQIRTYRKVGGKTFYSDWSAKKAVKTK